MGFLIPDFLVLELLTCGVLKPSATNYGNQGI